MPVKIISKISLSLPVFSLLAFDRMRECGRDRQKLKIKKKICVKGRVPCSINNPNATTVFVDFVNTDCSIGNISDVAMPDWHCTDKAFYILHTAQSNHQIGNQWWSSYRRESANGGAY